jgi:telomere length regulation protein
MNPRNSDEMFAEAVRDINNRLRLPISRSSELLQFLSAPLAAAGLLPEKYNVYNTTPLPDIPSSTQSRWISMIQSTILEFIVPPWDTVLAEEFGTPAILEQYFCPTLKGSWAGFEFALSAYSTLLAIPLSRFAVRLLSSLNLSYPIDELHEYLFRAGTGSQSKPRIPDWEGLVRATIAIPSKVANGAIPLKLPIPARLQPRFLSMPQGV